MSIHFLRQTMTSLDDVNAFAGKAWEEITGGEVAPLDLLTLKKFFEFYFEQLLKDKDIDNAISAELDKYGDKEKCVHMGMTITRASKQSFDFDDCNDVLYSELLQQQKNIAAKIKERTAFLKTLKQSVFDSENGGHEIVPPVSTSAQYFIVK